MSREKLFQLYQKVPNLFEITDKVFHSEPFIEKSSTFEVKTLLALYSIAVGVFFSKRVRKNARIFFWTYHIGCTLAKAASCVFYLSDLTSYDFRAVALGLAPIFITSMKFIYLYFLFRMSDALDKMIEFFINDDAQQSDDSVDLESANGASKIKKWVIVVFSIVVCFFVAHHLTFDPRSQVKTGGFTKKRFLSKYFPVWYPFESGWAFTLVSIFQDAIVVPEACLFFSGSSAIFLSVVMIRDKFDALYAKLRFLSDRAFERIDRLEDEARTGMEAPDNRIRLNKIKILDGERIHAVTMFYEDFVKCVERFQQLKRIQLLYREYMGYYCTVTYCFLLSIMIAFGFVGAEASFGHKHDFNLIVRMLIMFSLFGLLWYMNCVVGDMFSEQNDSFAKEVYSMPWYYFASKQRKTVLTLLAVIQKPTYLKALNLIRVKKDSFPDFLNSVYSYIQIIRTLQSVKNRRL